MGYFVKRHIRLQWSKKYFCRFYPFLHSAASTKTKKETEDRDLFSQKGASIAAQLRGMRLNLTSQKDTLMLWRYSNISYILLDFNFNYIMYFNNCANIRIRI